MSKSKALESNTPPANNDQILNALTPEVVGIIWIRNEPLKKLTRSFNFLDYLSGGQLITLFNSYHEQENKMPNRGVYITNSYGKPLIIAKIIIENAKTQKDDGEDILSIMQNNASEEQNRILVIEDGITSHLPISSDKFSELDFQHLRYLPES